MFVTTLRKVGGSVMLAVPPALLDVLQLSAGAKVAMTVDDGRLVVEPKMRPRYTLDALIAECEPSAAPSEEDRAWLDASAIGNELP